MTTRRSGAAWGSFRLGEWFVLFALERGKDGAGLWANLVSESDGKADDGRVDGMIGCGRAICAGAVVLASSRGDPRADTGEAGLASLPLGVDGGSTSPFRYSGVGGLILSDWRRDRLLRSALLEDINLRLRLVTLDKALPIECVELGGVSGRVVLPGNRVLGAGKF